MNRPTRRFLHRLPLPITLVLLLISISLLWFITRPDFLSKFFPRSSSGPLSSLVSPPTPTIIPSPTPTPFTTYSQPQLPDKPAYTIILAGDSMIKDLGPHGDRLESYLKTYYPDKVFGIFNYAYSSSNVLSLQQRLEQDTADNGSTFPAILNRQFDIIIIESFAYNPLSQLPLDQGLTQQDQALYQAVTSIISTHPESVIIFLATIKPNVDNFGLGVLDLTPEARHQWAEERISYLENHISFAQQYSLPLINLYQTSQLDSGQVDPQFVNSNDHIHPSVAGIELTAGQIAEFIINNKIIPQP